GPQEAGDQRNVLLGLHRRGAVVHQRVGFQRDQGVDLIGGGDAHRFGQSADVADVAADFVGVADADADQFEHRVLDDFGDHHLADEAGAPDHHSLLVAYRHTPPPSGSPVP